jgi:hypothetical protein
MDRSIQLLLLWISEQFNFYSVRLSASRPTSNLEDQGQSIEDKFWVKEKDFSLLYTIQTGSGTHHPPIQ